MTAARGLAFELSQLPAAERVRLLDELPTERRAQMAVLVQEVSGLLDAPERSFEQHLEIAAAAPPQSRLQQLNDYQLRLLMSSEHPSVQRRIATAVRKSQLSQLAPAVDGVVSAYLLRKLEGSEVRRNEPRVRVGGWRKWWRLFR